MPLKHLTETVLISALAAVVLLTGVLVSLLPALPGGFTPWIILFLLTIAYPLSLYGMLRKNRADYWFRALHFLPAIIVLLWLLVETAASRIATMAPLAHSFTWGFAVVPVILSLLLLAAFCLHVIRRRVPRLSILSLLLVLFLLLAGYDVLHPHWKRQFAANAGWLLATASVSSQASPSSQSISSSMIAQLPRSSVPEEEAWRQKLRAVASAQGRISASATGTVAAVLSGAPVRLPGHPKHLPSAGAGFEGFAAFFLAGYCAVIQKRARRRFQ
jgi:hypothetical protein